MGHMVGKDLYKKVGKKLDSLYMRAPWNEKLYEVIKELYSPEEAELIVKIPNNLSSFDRIQKITKYEKKFLGGVLEKACSKGLIMDLWLNGKYYYLPSPLLIGVFEFSMMRMKDNHESKKLAELFRNYLENNMDFCRTNFHKGIKVSPMRSVPYEESFNATQFVEVLDYEKATEIVKSQSKFSISSCACRHQKLHLGKKECTNPLDTCSSFGFTAEYLIRHGFAQEVSKDEMLDNITRSKELGLAFNADNVQNNVNFICHCCKCCCTVFNTINNLGYQNVLVSSNYIASVDTKKCLGCGICKKSCPVNAITIVTTQQDNLEVRKSKVDEKFCLGCGVCASKCPQKAIRLIKREQRVLHPETTFERIILQSLEKGTLQNQIFDNPNNLGHKFMRIFLAVFLKLDPIKKALMSDILRSRFLSTCKFGYNLTNSKWMEKV